jgi:DNA-directed RNA polymerase I subunit RPA49
MTCAMTSRSITRSTFAVADRLQLLTQDRIRAYFAELGCKVTIPTMADLTKWKLTKAEANNHYIAKLKLPLSFPKVGGPRKSRR